MANFFVSLSESTRFLLLFRHSPFDVALELSREEKDSRCERKLVYRELINIVRRMYNLIGASLEFSEKLFVMKITRLGRESIVILSGNYESKNM